MKIPESEVASFEDHYYANYHELQQFDSHFYDEAKREIRIYFPVQNVLVEHGGQLTEANELGEFALDALSIATTPFSADDMTLIRSLFAGYMYNNLRR